MRAMAGPEAGLHSPESALRQRMARVLNLTLGQLTGPGGPVPLIGSETEHMSSATAVKWRKGMRY
jgi:hypothetical protein